MSAASCSSPSSTSAVCWCGRASPSRQRRHGHRRCDRRSAARQGCSEPGKARRCASSAKRSGGKGWSDDIIDLAPLGLADADLALSVDRLVYKNVTTGRSRLASASRIAWRRSTLEDVQLYSGRARGVLTLDGRAQTAATTTNLTLDGVSALPLLSDALEFRLARRTRHDRPLAGRAGPLRAADRRDLRGKVELSVTEGAIVGVDIGRVLARHREGALLRPEAPIRRQDALQRVRRLVRGRQRRRSEPGPAADQSASARERLGLRQSRPAPGRLHRAPEDRGEPDW